jgi:hypothetical protein
MAPPRPDPTVATRAADTFDIAPDALVLADASDARLVVSLGAPAATTTRQQGRLLLGMVGAILAIASAMTLAILVGSSS